MSQIGVGFVGAGFMAQLAHIPSFLASPLCNPIALADARPDLARRVAEKHGITKVYDSHLALAADPAVEAVAAILPWGLNAQVAIDLLNAGKHVFLEKAMAGCVVEAEQMLEAQKKSGKLFAVGYMKRCDAGVVLARERTQHFISSQEIGPVTFVRAHCFGGNWTADLEKQEPPETSDEPAPDGTPHAPHWLPQPLVDRFHFFHNVHCHNLNLVRFLLGGDLTAVGVRLGAYSTLVTLEWNGVPVSLESGLRDNPSWDEETIVFFRYGYVKVSTPPPLLRGVPARVEVMEGGREGRVVRPVAPWSWAFHRQAEHFLECVAYGKEPVFPASDSIADTRLCEGIFRLAITGGQQ